MKRILICFLLVITVILSLLSCNTGFDEAEDYKSAKDYTHSINFYSFSDAVDFIYEPNSIKYSAYKYHKSTYNAMCESLKKDGFFYTVESSLAETTSGYSYAITLDPARNKVDIGTSQGNFYYNEGLFHVYVKTIDESLLPVDSFREYVNKKEFASHSIVGNVEILDIDKNINSVFTENLCYIPLGELSDPNYFVPGAPVTAPDNNLLGKIDDTHYICIFSNLPKKDILEFAKSLSITKVYFDACKD